MKPDAKLKKAGIMAGLPAGDNAPTSNWKDSKGKKSVPRTFETAA
ncbi:MAG: hypothetical protein PWQ57_2053 [Desulfovibrionales bacterium]|nr:hypothetical protein [Desulfovibrionales bacterium]